ncbi:MAG: glutaminyl-peptide cyclotransferase, partial [Thermomicrobiales bacterium]|nr:glutaminyl-peptide cyclotransferase [Thermomicrobiales bacterium]
MRVHLSLRRHRRSPVVVRRAPARRRPAVPGVTAPVPASALPQRSETGRRRPVRAGALLAVALVVSLAAVAHADPAVPQAPVWGYRVVAAYPHDPTAFTQGLAVVAGVLYEGTGLVGESSLRRVDLATGTVLQSVALAPPHFGEGIAAVGDRLYQLTWQTGTCFVYDRQTFALRETFSYPTEGWGLASDGERLVMSDGTDALVFRDPATFAETDRVAVRDGAEPVDDLNELEVVDGEVWANVWKRDRIARIDPANGRVTGWIDLTGLLPPQDRPEGSDAVLNGIAHDPDTGRLFVTGKLWPTLFEIALVPPAASAATPDAVRTGRVVDDTDRGMGDGKREGAEADPWRAVRRASRRVRLTDRGAARPGRRQGTTKCGGDRRLPAGVGVRNTC